MMCLRNTVWANLILNRNSLVIPSVSGQSAEECLPYLVDAVIRGTGPELIFTVGLATGTYKPMLVLSPIIARMSSRLGFSKADILKHLFEHARIPARQFENCVTTWTGIVPGKRTLYDLVALGKAPKIFGASRDPERDGPICVSTRRLHDRCQRRAAAIQLLHPREQRHDRLSHHQASGIAERLACKAEGGAGRSIQLD